MNEESVIDAYLKSLIKDLELEIAKIQDLIKKLPENKWYYFRDLKEYSILLELDKKYGDRIVPFKHLYKGEKHCKNPDCKIPHIIKEYDFKEFSGEFDGNYSYFLCNKEKLEILNEYTFWGDFRVYGYYILEEEKKQ